MYQRGPVTRLWRQWGLPVVRISLRLLFIYLLVVAGVWALQGSLLYPAALLADSVAQEQARRLGVEAWPEAASPLGYLATPAGPVVGNILIWHGNGGTALDRGYYLRALLPLGYRVLLVEYPGYGVRPGRPSEAVLVADGVAVLEQFAAGFGVPLYLMGESLGSAVAAAVAAQRPHRVDGIALITPWADLAVVAADYYPWIPVSLLLRDRYPVAHHLASFRGGKALVIAMDDEVIAPRHAEALYQRLSPPKRQWRLPESGHNDWSTALTTADWQEILSFLRQYQR
jgi:uncharacterized protein